MDVAEDSGAVPQHDICFKFIISVENFHLDPIIFLIQLQGDQVTVLLRLVEGKVLNHKTLPQPCNGVVPFLVGGSLEEALILFLAITIIVLGFSLQPLSVGGEVIRL